MFIDFSFTAQLKLKALKTIIFFGSWNKVDKKKKLLKNLTKFRNVSLAINLNKLKLKY